MSQQVLITFCLLLFATINASGQRTGSGFDPYSRFGDTPPGSQNQLDTIDRPDLKVAFFNFDSIHRPQDLLDTTLVNIQRIEPYYQEDFINLNLGSALSAGQLALFSFDNEPLSFGINQYQMLWERTQNSYLVEANRPYMNLYFGQGMSPRFRGILGSSDLNATFYKTFARRIYFNFDYKSLSDDGSAINQASSFKRMDIKFAQRSKSGNRTTWVQYDRPVVEEAVRYNIESSNTGAFNLKRDDFSVVIGNQWRSKDSSTVNDKLILNNTLEFYQNKYSVGSGLITTDTLDFLFLGIDSTSVDVQHQVSGWKFDNEMDVSLFNGRASFGVNAHSLTQKFSSDSTTFVGVNGKVAYEKNWSFGKSKFQFDIGFGDAGGHSRLEVDIDITQLKNFDINLTLGNASLLPTLAQQRLIVNENVFQSESWDNIKRLNFQSLVGYRPTNSSVKLGYSRYRNLLVMSRQGLFQQVPDNADFFNIQFGQFLKLGPFSTEQKLLIQKVESALIGLPELQYSGNANLEFRIFKKRMLVQLGADYYVMPSFETSEFDVVTGSFTNFDRTSRSGNIFIVNPYLVAKVDKLYLFVKGINNNKAFLSNDTFLIRGAPEYSYRIRFGFRWILLD